MSVRFALPFAVLAAAASPEGGRLPGALPPRGFEPREVKRSLDLPAQQAEELRKDALARARVWLPPERPLARADLGTTQAGRDRLVCKFLPQKTSGRTPKFDCVFQDGSVLKVKYDSPEVHSEVAASRLLAALGFGADRMHFVERLRCFGCPKRPHVMLQCLSSPFDAVRRDCEAIYGRKTPEGGVALEVDYAKYTDFENVSVEERKDGKAIRTEQREGWGFDELEAAQAKGGGDSRAHRDALRLLAAFLNHWDNRSDNQRLLCLPGAEGPGEGECRRPFAYLNDIGGTFGHVAGPKRERKLALDGWKSVPVFKDPRRCVVAIQSPPLHGATFQEAVISEAGRRFVAQRLGRLTPAQIHDLFEGAGFRRYASGDAAERDLANWVAAFQQKVRQITKRSACPAT
jgi:hypothetical protein